MRDEPRTVACLLCHAHVEMALAGLGSLLAYSHEPLRLRLHDDGSLTAADGERLRAGLAGAAGPVEIVGRAEADERLAGLLATRPASRAFRRRNPLGLKLIDGVALAAEEVLAYCDSDVLFRRPFGGLFEIPAGAAAGAVLMADRQSAYSVRSWQLLLDRRLRLPCRVNSGVFVFRRCGYDADLVEWFLARQSYHRTPPWVEQTAWALLAARVGCRLYDPGQLAFPEPGPTPAPAPAATAADPVALHFVSPLRSSWPEHLQAARDRTGEPPVAIRSAPAPPCGPLRLLSTELRRRLGR